MKKNIIIVLLLFATVLFGFYGSVKASEAEKNLVVAKEQEMLAQKNAEEAQKQSELAAHNAALAVEARAELMKCQTK
ncbi:MAG: hypothetical protein ABJG78_10540 [Cyclobacteriaceae bacterium]